uniref:Uncharacterized protein n=1 Tax=Rhizophora mucronata TaxID=61149 RepID=A0A2P2P5X7_RHIMU
MHLPEKIFQQILGPAITWKRILQKMPKIGHKLMGVVFHNVILVIG